MSTCRHEMLTLVPARAPRLRCRHCHLTITAQELGEDCCPECLEQFAVRRRDFEPIESGAGEQVRYRCETCGMIIDV